MFINIDLLSFYCKRDTYYRFHTQKGLGQILNLKECPTLAGEGERQTNSVFYYKKIYKDKCESNGLAVIHT